MRKHAYLIIYLVCINWKKTPNEPGTDEFNMNFITEGSLNVNHHILHNLFISASDLCFFSGIMHIFTTRLGRATWHLFTKRSHVQSDTNTWCLHCKLKMWTIHSFIFSMEVTAGAPWLWLVQKNIFDSN